MSGEKRKNVKIKEIGLVLCWTLFTLFVPSISDAATSRPAPRAGMDAVNAQNEERNQQTQAEAERLETLERLRRQYPGLEIPEDAEIIWAAAEPSEDGTNLTSGDTVAADLLSGFPPGERPQPQKVSVENPFEQENLGGLEYTSELPLEEEMYNFSAQDMRDAQLAQIWMDVQEDLTLRAIDKKALELVKEFAGAKNAVPPTPGQNGAVTYNFGDHIPKIICRMNRVTDISLQAGEQVTGVHMGDTVRWEISPAKSGAGSSETVHVIIKPLVPDISTNLVVMTDRRTYNLDLVSSGTEFIPSVRFAYPGDVMENWSSFMKAAQEKRQDSGLVLSESYRMEPENLNFGYEIAKGGSYDWAPVRIFDDGLKTYIEMPSRFKSLEAPVVMFFEGRQQKIVNYRIKDRYYIIDRVMTSSPGKASLILGQRQVVIQKLRPGGKS